MAKRNTTKNKDAAKEKVANLLKGTILASKEEQPEVDVLEKASEAKDTGWLTDQITILEGENAQLKDDLERAFNDIKKLRNAPDAPIDAQEIKKGVQKIFKDLENAHFGRNPEKKTYHEAIIKILLGTFLKTFPFLMKK